jgi:apoptotic chromatin condensation inducer in the nucleus
LECAAKAQSNLHGLQWPERTGRQLTAEFISAEQAETLIKLDNGSGRRPSQSAIAVGASTAAAAPTGIRSLFARATKAAVDSTAKAREQALEQHQQQLAANEAAQAESPDAVSEAAQEEMYKPPPAVNIDLLYRRTVTKPEIYYLPLTDEQVAEKKREIST